MVDLIIIKYIFIVFPLKFINLIKFIESYIIKQYNWQYYYNYYKLPQVGPFSI